MPVEIKRSFAADFSERKIIPLVWLFVLIFYQKPGCLITLYFCLSFCTKRVRIFVLRQKYIVNVKCGCVDWKRADDGLYSGGTNQDRLPSPLRLLDAQTRGICWSCAGSSGNNGRVIPPARRLFLSPWHVDLKENVICLPEQTPSPDPQSCPTAPARPPRTRELRPRRVGGRWAAWPSGTFHLWFFFLIFCFYDSQSWRPWRSEGISKQNVQVLTERWRMTSNLEKRDRIYLGKNSLEQRFWMAKGNLARCKSERNVRVITADYMWATRSFRSCLRAPEDSPVTGQSSRSPGHTDLDVSAHTHRWSANSILITRRNTCSKSQKNSAPHSWPLI